MNTLLINRKARINQLPIVLLMLALNVGFASVGLAEEVPGDTPSPTHAMCGDGSNVTVWDEMQAKARLAAWKTRISVATELGARLRSDHGPRFRLAATVPGAGNTG